MKSRTMAFGETGYSWAIITSPYKKARLISEKQAKDAINIYGLICAHRTEDGRIYDTPEKTFYRAFKRATKNRAWMVDDDAGFKGNAEYEYRKFLKDNL